MPCGCKGNSPPQPSEPTERTVFEVSFPDGKPSEEFANFGPAQRRRNEVDGASLAPKVVIDPLP